MLRFCDDIVIAMVAMVSKLVGSLFLGFAKSDALVYVCEYNVVLFNARQTFKCYTTSVKMHCAYIRKLIIIFCANC